MFICLSNAILRHTTISEFRYRIKISRVSTGATFLSYNWCCPSLTDGSVHPSVTWSLSSCVMLRFPLSSPVVSTKPWFSSWDRGINREIRCQRCVHQKDFLWRWPTCGGALAEEGVRLAPLVTLTDSCYCSECKINATRHNWTIVNARAKQSVLCEHPVVPQTATRG